MGSFNPSRSNINNLTGSGGMIFDTTTLIVDEENDRVGIGDASPDAVLDIQGTAAAGVPSLLIDHDDVDKVAVSVVAANTTANVLDLAADAVTTANVIDITADALTSGGAIYIDDDSASTTSRELVRIIQNNAAAIAATALVIQSDGGVTGINLDKNYSDTTAATVHGLIVDIDKTGASTSNNSIFGVNIDVDNTTATNGTNTMTGLRVTPTLTHAADAGTALVKGIDVEVTAGTNGAGKAVGVEITVAGGDTNYALTATGGHAGFGTVSPGAALHVYGNSGGTGYAAMFQNDGDNANRYGMKITAGADDASGTTYYILCADGDGGTIGYIANTSGTFALTDPSDARIKNNIRITAINGLEIINAIQVRDFEMKKNGISKTGFVAQELDQAQQEADAEEYMRLVLKTNPESDVDEDGNMIPMGISYANLIPALVKSIQELTARVAELENK